MIWGLGPIQAESLVLGKPADRAVNIESRGVKTGLGMFAGRYVVAHTNKSVNTQIDETSLYINTCM